MKYYKNTYNNDLIEYNNVTKKYKQRNTLSLSNVYISYIEFNKLNTVQIKFNKFFELLNLYFNSVKHEWEYDGIKYCKLDNFEVSSDRIKNYKLHRDIPYHEVQLYNMLKTQAILVWHYGRVFYFVTHNGYGYTKGMLLSTKDLSTKKVYIKLKHCAPIYNLHTKTIM